MALLPRAGLANSPKIESSRSLLSWKESAQIDGRCEGLCLFPKGFAANLPQPTNSDREHVYRIHALPISCPRCHEAFGTDREKDEHISRVERCPFRDAAKADGIDATQRDLLRNRKRKQKQMSEAQKWAEMYLVIFPDADATDVPSPCG